CIDWADVEAKRTHKTRAFIPVDYAGYPAGPGDTDLLIIQDAAHAPGGVAYGDMMCLSFHPVKPLATGDGGAILLDDGGQYERLQALRWCGIDRSTWQRSEKRYGWDYDINEVGYKCHWNDIQAAIGLVQLDRLDEMQQARRKIADLYQAELSDWVDFAADHPKHTNHLMPVRVSSHIRDGLINALLEAGYSAGLHYKPLTLYPMYKQETPPNTALAWRQLISLPIFADLSPADVVGVCDIVEHYVGVRSVAYG
ncbi:MAG: hypothetical protein AMJ53_15270, partial [Gammaproteobacteria bacterium SG8_11]